MYKVIKRFTDLQDNGHKYNVGDVFPRDGAVVTEGRINQLSSDANRQRVPLIVEVKDDMTDDSLNLASPAQSEKVEQEAFLKNDIAVEEQVIVKEEKPRNNRRKKVE